MHIGKLIREQVDKQGKSGVWLANQLSCSRTNIYKIYDRPSIDTGLLLRISLILDYNFFAPYSEKIEKRQQLMSLIGLHANKSGTH